MSYFNKLLLMQGLSNSTGSGGANGFSLISHTGQGGNGNTTVTSPAITTTGANLLVVPFSYSGLGIPTASGIIDSYHNIWNVSAITHSQNPRSAYFYSISPTVGTNHSVSVAAISLAAVSLQFFAFSKISGSPSLDGESSGSSTANWQNSTLLPGVIIPTTSNNLFLSSVVWDVSSTASVNSGYTILDSPKIATDFFDSAYKIKSNSSTSENPGWTALPTTNADAWVNGISFK